jgi:hypothetical protein
VRAVIPADLRARLIAGRETRQIDLRGEERHKPVLACIIHQRWKVSRTVVGIEDERQEGERDWDGARAREVASDSDGILREGSACNRGSE